MRRDHKRGRVIIRELEGAVVRTMFHLLAEALLRCPADPSYDPFEVADQVKTAVSRSGRTAASGSQKASTGSPQVRLRLRAFCVSSPRALFAAQEVNRCPPDVTLHLVGQTCAFALMPYAWPAFGLSHGPRPVRTERVGDLPRYLMVSRRHGAGAPLCRCLRPNSQQAQ